MIPDWRPILFFLWQLNFVYFQITRLFLDLFSFDLIKTKKWENPQNEMIISEFCTYHEPATTAFTETKLFKGRARGRYKLISIAYKLRELF